MSGYNIKCRIIEEELKTFWPQWHVVSRIGGGAFGDVFLICRDNFGIRVESALKVIQISDAMEMPALFPHRKENAKKDERETLETARVFSGSQSAEQVLSKENEEDSDSATVPEALRNEIRIMEALRGAPNIVIIEDFFFKKEDATSSLFVRMEFLVSFQELLFARQKDDVQFSLREVIKIGRDVCTALMYCEKKGIIHRDLKPANLFVDSFGNYKVGDFGVSKLMDTVHIAHTMTGIGTISYIAPEIFRGQPYNNTVDIYALGLILYQLLNNSRVPFLPTSGAYTSQEIDSAIYRRLRGSPLPSLEGLKVGNGNETIDAFLDEIVRRACAYQAGDRFQTAKAFREALDYWESGQTWRESLTEDDRYHRSAEQNQRFEERMAEDDESNESEPRQSQQIKQQSKSLQISGALRTQKIWNGHAKTQTYETVVSNTAGDNDASLSSGQKSAGRTAWRDVQEASQSEIKNGIQTHIRSDDDGQDNPGYFTSKEEHERGSVLFLYFAGAFILTLIFITGVWILSSGSEKRQGYEFHSSTNNDNNDLISDASGIVTTQYEEAVQVDEAEIEKAEQAGERMEEDEIGSITDTWEEIIAAGGDGTYAEKYRIGDTKELDLGIEGVIRMELVALDTDELADGKGNAHMTWIAKDLINSEHNMNEKEAYKEWSESDLRKWLRESVLPLFPKNVRLNIKEVIKYSNPGWICSSVDTIWIPSTKEVLWGENDFWVDWEWGSDRGVDYTTAFPDNKSRKKSHIGSSVASEWWLRCHYDDDVFGSVSANGNGEASCSEFFEVGVAFGFCL